MGRRGIEQRKHEAAKATTLGITRMTLNRYRRRMAGEIAGSVDDDMKRRISELDRSYASRDRIAEKKQRRRA